MNKNIIKTLFISLALLFSIGFINIDKVDAASCSCYYTWATTGANTTNTTEDYFFAQIKFSDSNAETVKSCNYSYNSSNDGSRQDAIAATTNCNGKIALDSNFVGSVKRKAIVKANCDVKACGTAKIYVKPNESAKSIAGSLTITKNTSLYGVSTAIEAVNFNKAVEQNNERTKNADNADNLTIDDINTESISKWAKKDETESPDAGSVSCDLIPKSIIKFLNNLFLILQIIGIILLIFLTGVEFVKIITGSEEKGLTDALKNTIRRIVLVILLLILPTIITWLLNVINDNRYEKKDGNYVIGADGNPLCK